MYLDETGMPRSIPKWGQFFVSLGSTLALLKSETERFVVAVAAPTRAYATAFIASAYISEVAKRGPSVSEIRRHYDTIAKLPIGSAVSHRKGDRLRRCIFQGCTIEDFGAGKRAYLAIQVENESGGNTIERLPWEKSMAIEVREEAEVSLPKNQRGRTAVRNVRFVESVVGAENADHFLTISRLNAVIVGHGSLFSSECRETEFCSQNSAGRLAKGILQDIIRLRRFQGQTFTYRAELVSPSAEAVDPFLETAPMTFFDGALGFIRLRDFWPDANWLIVLDRSDPGFRDAANEINSEFIQRRSGVLETQKMETPPGIELLAFKEAK